MGQGSGIQPERMSEPMSSGQGQGQLVAQAGEPLEVRAKVQLEVRADNTTSFPRIGAVILSAGLSSRMGDFKPLLRIGVRNALEHAVDGFLQAGIEEIVVVTGHRADEVANVAESLGVKVVHNPSFEEGMFSSVQAGVGALREAVEAFFLLPVDHPLVEARTIEALVDVSKKQDQLIVYPTYHGKRGHPPLISMKLADEILNEVAPDGLRVVLAGFDDEASEIAVADEAILLDMDEPADYERLQQYWLRKPQKPIPTLEECEHLLQEKSVNARVWEHSHLVAGFALALARQLNQVGAHLDEALVLSSAMLHDVAKTQKDHAHVGARMVEAKGYLRVAEIIAVHMDIVMQDHSPITEAEVVYLADKLTKDSRRVTITERFEMAQEKFGDRPEALMVATSRLQQADRIRRKVERMLGQPIEMIETIDLLPKI